MKAVSTRDLPSWRLFIYALPALAMTMAVTPAGSVLPALYATQAGIGLAAIGSVVFFGRILDAVVDPAIAILSDATRGRFGRRKPWVLLSAPLLGVCVWFLFAVPAKAGVAYFATWYLLTFVAWSMIEIPYRAWGTELSRDRVGRARVSTWLGAAWAAGPLLFLALPFLPAFGGGGAMDGPFLRKAVFVVLALTAVGIPLCVLLVPQGRRLDVRQDSLPRALQAIATNKPLLWFIAIFLFGGLGGGITSSLIVLYMKTVLGMGDQVAKVLMAYTVTHLLGAPIAFQLVKRWGKQRVWSLAWLTSALILPFMIFIPPGPEGVNAFVVLVGLRGLFAAVDTVAPMAMLGDIADYDLLKSGSERVAGFTAVLLLIIKLNGALATAAGFWLLGVIGFQPNGPNSPEVVTAFKVLFCIAPPVLMATACALLWRFPLNERRQAIVRRRTEQRAARAARTEAVR